MAPLEFLAPFAAGLAAALAVGLGDVLDDFAEALGLAALDVFVVLDVSAALVCFGDAFFPGAADLASFDRSAIAAPAPDLASRGFAVDGFFAEMVLLIGVPPKEAAIDINGRLDGKFRRVRGRPEIARISG